MAVGPEPYVQSLNPQQDDYCVSGREAVRKEQMQAGVSKKKRIGPIRDKAQPEIVMNPFHRSPICIGTWALTVENVYLMCT